MRTNKTMLKSIMGASVLLIAAGSVSFAADEKAPAKVSVPAVAVSAPKMEQFDPATFKGETGKIVSTYGGTPSVLLRKVVDGQPGDYLQPVGKDGVLLAPAGKYSVLYCNAVAKGKNGETWMVTPAINGEIEVKASGETKLGVDGKLLASIKSGKTGKISLPYAAKGASLSVAAVENGKRGDSLRITMMKDQAGVVPCGTYKVASYSATVAGKDGQSWSISVSYPDDKLQKSIEVKEGSEVKLESPEPMTASVAVKQDGDKVTMSLSVVNAKGANCTLRSLDPKAEAPGFQVLSKSGEVLMSGKFQYG